MRYARHLSLPEIGDNGQKKLSASKVLVVGAGGLGSPVLLYLAAAGIGSIGIADDDKVDESNLQRQMIHDTAGKNKTQSAKERLNALNPYVRIALHPRIDENNAKEILSHYDVIVDCSDNIATRYLVNDACFFLRKILVYASAIRMQGQCTVFTHDGPCYRCMIPHAQQKENCSDTGVLGSVVGIIGCIQATETIKAILGLQTLEGTLLTLDARTMDFCKYILKKRENCELCGKKPKITKIVSVQIACMQKEIDVAHCKKLMEAQNIFLFDVREQPEWDAGHIPSATFLPLSSLEEKFPKLNVPKTAHIILHCRSGVRSLRALQIFEENGYKNVQSLKGGIKSYAKEVDPSITVV